MDGELASEGTKIGSVKKEWSFDPEKVTTYRYPQDGAHYRFGFVRDAVVQPDQLSLISDMLTVPFDDDFSKNLVRAYINKSLLQDPSARSLLPHIESFIDMEETGIPELANFVQIIFASADKTRTTDPEVIQKELAQAKTLYLEGKAKYDSLEKPGTLQTPEGVELLIVDQHTDDRIKKEYMALMEENFTDEEDVLDNDEEQYYGNPAVIKAAATIMNEEGEAEVVGVIALSNDSEVVRIQGKEIRVVSYEVIGAKVKQDITSRGIYTALAVRANQQVYSVCPDIAYVVGYSNAEDPTVIKVAGKTGRRFVPDVIAEYGITNAPGLAMKQSKTGEDEYVDEIVTYLPGNELRKSYGIVMGEKTEVDQTSTPEILGDSHYSLYEYPEDGCNWRIGILDRAIESKVDLDSISELLSKPFTADITRNMVRAYISTDYLMHPDAKLSELFPHLEVLVNLADSGISSAERYCQVIFARNSEERSVSEDVLRKEVEDARQFYDLGHLSSLSFGQKKISDNVTIKRITALENPKLLDQYIQHVTASFAEDAEELGDGIRSGEILAYAAIEEVEGMEKVVGSVYASEDTDTVVMQGKEIEIPMFEIDGAKVIDELRGAGLYAAMLKGLYKEISERRSDVAAVFGYSNTQDRAVFVVAGKAGRQFVPNVIRDMGVSALGIAVQQTTTDSDKYVDEIVTYISGNDLRKLYGEKAGV